MPSVKKTTGKEKQQKGSIRRKQKGGIIIFPLDTEKTIPTISCSKDNENDEILQVNGTDITDSITFDTIPCENAIFLYKKLHTKEQTYEYAYYVGFKEFKSFWKKEQNTLVKENEDKEVHDKHFIYVFDVDSLITSIEADMETQQKYNESLPAGKRKEPIIPTNPLTRDKLEEIITSLINGIEKQKTLNESLSDDDKSKKEKLKEKLKEIHTFLEKYNKNLNVNTIVDTHTDLLTAAGQGNLPAIQARLQEGADVNKKNFYGLTALVYASTRGYLPIVAELLRAGAKDERLSYNITVGIQVAKRFGFKLKKTSALEEAAKYGHTDVIKELLRYYQSLQQDSPIHNNKEEALMEAVEHNHLPIVKLLVEEGTNVNTNTGFPLQQATSYALKDIVEYLLSKGADIHINKEAALRVAIEEVDDNIKIAEWKKTRNNPHATYETEIEETETEETEEAQRFLDIVKILLAHGANVHSVKIPKPIPENSIHKQLLTILQTAKKQQPKPPTLFSRVKNVMQRPFTRSTQVVPLPQDGGSRITYQGKSYKLCTEKDTGKKYITVGKEKTRVYVRTSKKGKLSFRKA